MNWSHLQFLMHSSRWHIIKYSFLFQYSPHILSILFATMLETCIQRRQWAFQQENMFSTQTCFPMKTHSWNKPSFKLIVIGLDFSVRFWNLRSWVDGTSITI